MNYNAVVSAIEEPRYRDTKVKKYQSTKDIIKDLIDCFKTYNYQAIPVAQKYYTGNLKTDAKNIWNFIRKNIKYEAESEKDQTSKSFSRVINDRQGDCKHSALIVGSIGWNEGYNVIFRVVEYDGAFETVTHVYAILQDPKTLEKVIVDPLQNFNYEKEYSKKIGDYKATINHKNMALSRLTGVNPIYNSINNPINSGGQVYNPINFGNVQRRNINTLKPTSNINNMGQRINAVSILPNVSPQTYSQGGGVLMPPVHSSDPVTPLPRPTTPTSYSTPPVGVRIPVNALPQNNYTPSPMYIPPNVYQKPVEENTGMSLTTKVLIGVGILFAGYKLMK